MISQQGTLVAVSMHPAVVYEACVAGSKGSAAVEMQMSNVAERQVLTVENGSYVAGSSRCSVTAAANCLRQKCPIRGLKDTAR